RSTAAIDQDDAIKPLDISENKSIATQARFARFSHSRHVEDRYGGIHGVPPILEDAQPGERLQRMLGGDHTIPSHDHRSPGGRASAALSPDLLTEGSYGHCYQNPDSHAIQMAGRPLPSPPSIKTESYPKLNPARVVYQREP